MLGWDEAWGVEGVVLQPSVGCARRGRGIRRSLGWDEAWAAEGGPAQPSEGCARQRRASRRALGRQEAWGVERVVLQPSQRHGHDVARVAPCHNQVQHERRLQPCRCKTLLG